MGTRLELHNKLCMIMGGVKSGYEKQVYFQPPPTLKMVYPCIVYRKSTGDTQFADNYPYIHKLRYEITVIDRNPDSVIPEKIAELPMCIHDRDYTADNLNHDVFTIYF